MCEGDSNPEWVYIEVLLTLTEVELDMLEDTDEFTELDTKLLDVDDGE